MTRNVLTPCFSLLLAHVLMCAHARAENYAFLVGVNDYSTRQLKPLTFARDDVLALRDLLLSAGFDPDNVVTLHDDLRTLEKPRFLADADKIRTQFGLLLDGLQPDDSLIVAFAGHGVQFRGEDENYFCPLDVDLTDPQRSKLISFTEIYAQLEDCPARRKLLLVDACRSEPTRIEARNLESVTHPQLPDPPEGVIALFSCAEGQEAFEDPDLQHGVFFYHVLQALEGSADNGDRQVTLDELLAYTKSRTTRYARIELNTAQTPRQRGFFEGEWILREITSITNTIGMRLVLIPAGEFLMGSRLSHDEVARRFESYHTNIQSERYEDEHPLHQVRITRAFYMGIHEVTVGQFRQFVASGYTTEPERDGEGGYGWNEAEGRIEKGLTYNWQETGWSQTDAHPVVNVTWNDARAFVSWLSGQEGRRYRLPTEAEWEFACRAGTESLYHSGDDPENLWEVANVLDRTGREQMPNSTGNISTRDGHTFTAPVGSFRPNAFGLYDMHGNVWEWCQDWYTAGYYVNSPTSDPRGPTSGPSRVLRGGSWYSKPIFVRSADRYGGPPSYRFAYEGFRVVCELE